MQLKGTAGRELPQAENKRMLKVYALMKFGFFSVSFVYEFCYLHFPFMLCSLQHHYFQHQIGRYRSRALIGQLLMLLGPTIDHRKLRLLLL